MSISSGKNSGPPEFKSLPYIDRADQMFSARSIAEPNIRWDYFQRVYGQ